MVTVNIKDHMRERNISYRELERLTKISKSTLNRIANNEKSPTLDQLEKIAIILNKSMDELYFIKNNANSVPPLGQSIENE